MLPPYTSPVIESKNPIHASPSMVIGDGETTNCTSAARLLRNNNDDDDDQYDDSEDKDNNDDNVEHDVEAEEHRKNTDTNKRCFLFTSPKRMMDMYESLAGPVTTFTPIHPIISCYKEDDAAPTKAKD